MMTRHPAIIAASVLSALAVSAHAQDATVSDFQRGIELCAASMGDIPPTGNRIVEKAGVAEGVTCSYWRSAHNARLHFNGTGGAFIIITRNSVLPNGMYEGSLSYASPEAHAARAAMARLSAS